MYIIGIFADLVRRTNDPAIKVRIYHCMKQAMSTKHKLTPIKRESDGKCRRCHGRKYVGPDGHTCEHCDGSGWEID